MFLRLRGLGVVFIITFQTFASLEKIYGDKGACEIITSCRNFIILGSGDHKDAKHAADLLGKYRGYEAQRSESVTDGTNTSETSGWGTSDGWGKSRTESKSYSFPNYSSSKSNSTSENKSTSRSGSYTEGKAYSETRGVTWIWVDRHHYSETELLRHPLPTPENGIYGLAYRAGDPRPHDFTYSWDFITEAIHTRNDGIPETIERQPEAEILGELTQEELRILNLERVNLKDPAMWREVEIALNGRPIPLEDAERLDTSWDSDFLEGQE